MWCLYIFSCPPNDFNNIIKTKRQKKFVDVIATTFPMGSMTGAPKIKAMELIEEYEETKRGVYSGSDGYINQKVILILM